mgnify:FL=1|jgi:hypothetical protein|tara:strand:- start:1665 stop:2276 length:612 start_codon:yes stop_codon:yes gene_type:complete
MYVSARKITAANGRMEDATAFATMLTQRINEKLGSDLGLAVEVGGDPNVLWLNGRWESLGDFQKFNEAFYADPQLVAAAAVTDSVASVTSDQINRMHRAPGDRNAYAVLSRGRIQMENFVSAMAFMDELAELATSVGGVETGIALPVTGDRYEAIFVQFAASMQELQDLDEKLFASEDYLAMFAKASQYMESRFDSVFAQRII